MLWLLYSRASWPDLFRPSTSFVEAKMKTWMPATSAGMTVPFVWRRHAKQYHEAGWAKEAALMRYAVVIEKADGN
jgi:hypothetical protein